MILKTHVQAVFQYLESCAKWKKSHCFDKTRFPVPKMLEKSVAKAMLGENLEIGSKLSPEPLETITEVKFEHVVSPYWVYVQCTGRACLFFMVLWVELFTERCLPSNRTGL